MHPDLDLDGLGVMAAVLHVGKAAAGTDTLLLRRVVNLGLALHVRTRRPAVPGLVRLLATFTATAGPGLFFFSLFWPKRALAWLAPAERSLSFSALSSFNSPPVGQSRPSAGKPPCANPSSSGGHCRCRRRSGAPAIAPPPSPACARSSHSGSGQAPFSSARAAASFSRLLSKTDRRLLRSQRARTDSRLQSSARASASPSLASSSAFRASAASARARSCKYRRSQSSADAAAEQPDPKQELQNSTCDRINRCPVV